MGKKKDKKSKAMENKIPTSPSPPSGNTKFQFPGIKIDCSNEPIWVKVLYYLVGLAALIVVLCIVQNWLLNVLAGTTLVTNLTKIAKSIRGKGS